MCLGIGGADPPSHATGYLPTTHTDYQRLIVTMPGHDIAVRTITRSHMQLSGSFNRHIVREAVDRQR